MKYQNRIKKQLREGKNFHAMFIQSASPVIAEVSVHAGWQIILIDNEHGFATLETTMHMIRAVESAGGEAIVRVPWNDQVYLKRVLDIGARSLMIPMINDKAAAEAAVAACRYPPLGARGYAAPVVRASCYGSEPDYGKRANEELLLIAQIEHVDAVDNIEEIAAVDGIDMLFIGPNDLAASMGHFENMAHPEVTAKVKEIEERVTATGTMLGGFPLPGTSAEEAEAKYRLVAGQADLWIFKTAAEKLAVT